MRIGIGINLSGTLDRVLERIRKAEDDGFASAWVANGRSFDAIGLCSLAGQATSRIELGTFVVPSYPRHPAVTAQQSLTAAAATDNRFTLGLGLSHRVIIEDALGLEFARPIGHMREYLSILGQLFRTGEAKFSGKEYRVNFQVAVPGAERPQVLLAALGPQMLRLAGTLADGTATWMGGPAWLERHAVPAIQAAAKEAGRPTPRVLAGVPIAVTADAEAGRAAAARAFGSYNNLPSYRAVLDAGGVSRPEDIAIIGGEEDVARQLRQFAEAGATDIHASPFGVEGDADCRTRTNDFLATLARQGL